MEDKKTEKKAKKSFKETVALMIRKKWLTSTAQTTILITVLVLAFIAINMYVQSLDIDTIDVTENKIYSLSDSSKDAISKIDKDITLNLYGIEEGTAVANFAKKYHNANEHIKIEFLSEESNLAKVQKYDLTSGYQIIVLECGDSSKIIDTSYEFKSYDYATGQEVDLTEQTLTNSILDIATDDKPNVYFTTGHEEYALDKELGVLSSFLKNESYIASSVNLLTEGKVPDNCDLLVIMAPVKDFMEAEVESVLNYINNGGNILVSSDVGNLAETYPNLSRVYNEYGVNINHSGYVYEKDSTRSLSNYPNIFMPSVSSSNDITKDIYTSGATTLWLVYAGRLEFVPDDQLTALNVKRDDILTSSDSALFIKDITQSPAEAANTAETGKSVISSVLTKTIKEAEEGKEDSGVESTAVFIANASFITDYKVQQLSETYPVSYLANNRDFMLNSIASLTKKENSLRIRKDMSSSTYAPTQVQHTIVVSVIFGVPMLIILAGIAVGVLRKRKR